MPQFKTYDGTKDPDDHLHPFCSIMQAQNASDALMCKIFPSTLRGNAQTWYYSLQSKLISSYAELAASFATKFSSHRLIRKTTSELMRVAQREGESLKNYMNRFNDAILGIDLFNQVGLVAIIQGFKHERFRDSLIKHPPITFDEANERSWKFIQAEEHALSGKPSPNKEDHGHTTKECHSLKSKLEGLARKRMLNDYISNKDQLKFIREQGRLQGSWDASNKIGVGYQQPPPPFPPPSRIIHMIIGGLETGGMRSKQQKLYVREMVSSFNIIIGRPILTEIQAVVSQFDLCMKFPTPMGVETLRDNQEVMGIELPNNIFEDEARATPAEEVEEVQLDDNDPIKKMQIETKLSSKEREELISFLKSNKDVFAWTLADMPGILTLVAVHKLSTHLLKKPVAQKRCLFRGERLKQSG
ncbi:hypothetical protein SLEP1_g36267 [Rubroshorea leprosula]|uniref:Retrotransposon gag domain-containing protein n=1 Tax=Rubroshorea leprosula TaxID=152421 RepID=A0AAV5KR61_9ROSI|nr:hypothetical protein SLEP1_g36267 [Rubroshorea leprosula]